MIDKRTAVKAMLQACEGLEDLEDCMNAAYDELYNNPDETLQLNNPASLCNKPDDLSCSVHAQIAPRIDVVTTGDDQLRGELLQQAVNLLERQRQKPLYKMDEQIKTSNEVAEFIKTHKRKD